MKRTRIDDYRNRMNGVELPESARARIEEAILGEREADANRTTCEQSPAERPSAPEAKNRSQHPAAGTARAGRRTPWRPAAMAACAALLVFGALLLAPSVKGLVGSAENSFVLSAYASGTSLGTADNVKLAFGKFANWGGWQTFDEADWANASPYENDFIHDTGMEKGYICSAYFDLTCEGSNIASLSYELEEGKGVYFNFDPARDGSTPPEDLTRYRFTVAPGDLANADKGYIYIVANVPAEGELAEPTAVIDEHLDRMDSYSEENAGADPRGQFTQEEEDEYLEAMERASVLVHTKAAEMVAEATIAITATFEDGTTETHRYRIAPVDDFADRYRAYEAARSEPREDPSSFFTIEQLS